MIYVDDTQEHTPAAVPGHLRHCSRRLARLWTEPGNEDELHAFAEGLRLKREWFQDEPGRPHYLVTPQKRAIALLVGVIAARPEVLQPPTLQTA